MIAGIGGTGVVTIGAILGTAAQIDGKGAGVLDMTGLSQKGGSVKSFLRIYNNPKEVSTIRLSYNDTNLLLGCDLLVSNDEDVLLTLNESSTKAIVNSNEVMTGEFTRNINFSLPSDKLKNNLIKILGNDNINFIPSNQIAKEILGDTIASNMFNVGCSYQLGLIPISSSSIIKAIELNGISVDLNIKAFNLGRNYFKLKKEINDKISKKLKIVNSQDKINNYYIFLIKYQNKKYANKFMSLINQVKKSEKLIGINKDLLSQVVAKNYFKLMSYKDEYEISRLYTDQDFYNEIKNNFNGNFSIYYNLAPPIFFKKDPITSKPIKSEFGPWMFYIFKILSFLKFLRHTPFDPFGYFHERKCEKKLIFKYEKLITYISSNLTSKNYDIAIEIASNYDQIRGFGYIKNKNIEIAKSCEDKLMSAFNA